MGSCSFNHRTSFLLSRALSFSSLALRCPVTTRLTLGSAVRGRTLAYGHSTCSISLEGRFKWPLSFTVLSTIFAIHLCLYSRPSFIRCPFHPSSISLLFSSAPVWTEGYPLWRCDEERLHLSPRTGPLHGPLHLSLPFLMPQSPDTSVTCNELIACIHFTNLSSDF